MSIEIKVKCTDDYERQSGPIHRWFSLSYAAYFVAPRLALQGMPIWWQKIFIWLVNMLPLELPEYSCQRRDDRGRFIDDPWANYRRGSVAEILKGEEKSGWKIINVEYPNK